MKTINCNQLYSLISNNFFMCLIDIRDNESFEKGHIVNSVNIPKDVLLNNPFVYLNYYTPYFLICDYGITSKDVALILESKGFDVTSITGGIKEWKYGLTRHHL